MTQWNRQTLAKLIDHAVLSPTATVENVEQPCRIGKQYSVTSVGVRPSDVTTAYNLLKSTRTCVSTVIGFPHGTTITKAKMAEAEQAMMDGARELDMVINIGRMLSNDTQYVQHEIQQIAQMVHQEKCLLKVILEMCYLSADLKQTACSIAVSAGADFLKTSTGFASSGATPEDVRLMREIAPGRVGIKASGGIRDLAQMITLVTSGANRIGTSSTAKIMMEVK